MKNTQPHRPKNSNIAKSLIQAPTTRRSFGFDTAQYAIGSLPRSHGGEDVRGEGNGHMNELGLRLSRTEYTTITKTLILACDKCDATGQPFVLSSKVNGSRIRYQIDAKRISSSKIAQKPNAVAALRGGRAGLAYADVDEVIEFELKVTCPNGRFTPMHVRTQIDRNRNYWLNVRANPSALINGYNAYAVRLGKLKSGAERSLVMQVPFMVLRAMLREVDPQFDWKSGTRDRIKKLQFKLCPVQVFTYLGTGGFTTGQFLGFLRAVLSSPYGDGNKNYGLLADFLGISMDAELSDDGEVQSLLLKFKNDGRIELSVNLYDKLAKAKADAAALQRSVGEEVIREFLGSNIRADITMHDAALGDLAKEAKLGGKGKAPRTAAMFNKAVHTLNLGKGKSGRKFVHWLLHNALDERLSFIRLLSYQPSMLDKARSVTADYNPDAVAVFDEWSRLGFAFRPKADRSDRSSGEDSARRPVSFEQFAKYHADSPVSRQVARTVRQKLLAIGLDLDIPLAAYDVLYEQSYHWDLPAHHRHTLAVAREKGDAATVARLTKRSRENSEASIRQIGSLVVEMIEGAHAPANRLVPKTS
jgi:hypothetical protein